MVIPSTLGGQICCCTYHSFKKLFSCYLGFELLGKSQLKCLTRLKPCSLELIFHHGVYYIRGVLHISSHSQHISFYSALPALCRLAFAHAIVELEQIGYRMDMVLLRAQLYKNLCTCSKILIQLDKKKKKLSTSLLLFPLVCFHV